MSAPFLLLLHYVISGTPLGMNADLFQFRLDQTSLEVCEQSKAAIERDFPAATAEGRMIGGCHMNVPELLDPASPPDCPLSLFAEGGYTIIGQPCPHYWIQPAAVHAP